jgi:hypothetical protein
MTQQERKTIEEAIAAGIEAAIKEAVTQIQRSRPGDSSHSAASAVISKAKKAVRHHMAKIDVQK